MKIEMIKIEPGKFTMGSPITEKDRYSDEDKVEVEITKPFEIMTTPVTQKQWNEVMGKNPSHFRKDENLPVDSVSWNNVQNFIKKLNEKTGENYLLPTEAEWEYSARAGTKTAYFFGDDSEDLEDYAWFYDNSEEKTHQVGMKKPNQWGLYDVYGNLWEWVQDAYSDKLPGGRDPLNESGSGRVLRGGGWYSVALNLRSANRLWDYPFNRYYNFGCRLVRTL